MDTFFGWGVRYHEQEHWKFGDDGNSTGAATAARSKGAAACSGCCASATAGQPKTPKMFKTKLQEYCQAHKLSLPEYSTTKEGLDHCPSFKASVVINGLSFTTPDFCKSTKEAKNLAAQIAFHHLTGMVHLHKQELQFYAQKRNLNLPVYMVEREGPPHASRFRCKVMLEGKTYESLEYFSTIKDAENAALKAALKYCGTKEEDPALYKTLLQELTMREYSCLPSYVSRQAGPPHNPIFSSTVELNEESFTGQEAKSKKLAEMNAAKVAYIALQERAHHQDSKPKNTLAEPESGTNFNQKICEEKTNALPFGQESTTVVCPRQPAIGDTSEPDALSPHKRIKVFPLTSGLKLPVGATVLYKDEGWVAVMNADSANCNV